MMRSTVRIISAFTFALVLFGVPVGEATPTQGKPISCRELFTRIVPPQTAPTPIPNATVVNIRLEQTTLVAEIAGGQPVRSNDAAEIIAAIRRSRAGATGPVYVDSTALQANRRAALEKSFENANRDSKLPIRYIEGLDPLFSGDAVREEIKVVDVGSNARGEYYQRADVKVGGKLFAMTVLCRVKAAAQTFIDRIRTFFGRPLDQNSTMAIINRVRKEVATQYNLSDDELRVQFKSQVGKTQWVVVRPAGNGRG